MDHDCTIEDVVKVTDVALSFVLSLFLSLYCETPLTLTFRVNQSIVQIPGTRGASHPHPGIQVYGTDRYGYVDDA